MKHIFYSLILAIAGLGVSAQNSPSISLKWKLNPGEILTYRTTMKIIDTATERPFSMAFTQLLQDTAHEMDKKQKDLFKQLAKAFDNSDFITRLTEIKKGVINIEMAWKDKENTETKDSSVERFSEINGMMKNLALRGAVYADGGVESFYVKSEQRNLLSLFFELPTRSQKIGDTWSLDLHLTSMDQNFKCDTSFRKNEVKLIDIKTVAGERIATIKYDIVEFSSGEMTGLGMIFSSGKTGKTMMKIYYNAIAQFSIDKGRWINYDGIMGLETSGFMDSKTTKKFALIPD